MTLGQHLRTITRHNVRRLREAPWEELSGALGDLGTLLPLMLAMALKGAIDLPATLVFSGLTNIATGAFFGIPLPVQPMKAIASVAISQSFSKQDTAAAGLTMGLAVFFLSASQLLWWLNKVVPVPVVRGIQVGAGLALVINAGASLIRPLDWARPPGDNRMWALAAFLLLVLSSLARRFPYALLVFVAGLAIAVVLPGRQDETSFRIGLWHPSPFVPSGHAWRIGAVDAAIPQLPLTTLNSILAVTSLSASLFPTFPPTPSATSIGLSIAIANLVGCWFGAMPICHGSGGLAGQYRFGARSGSSVILLGLSKLGLGLFVGDAVLPLLQRFPKSLLGVMVLAAGVELAKVGQSVGESRDLWDRSSSDSSDGETAIRHDDREQERRDRWMVMLITAAGCLAFKNDAVGFFGGLVWHWSLRLPVLVEYFRRGHRSVQLRQERQEDLGSGLLNVGRDAGDAPVA